VAGAKRKSGGKRQGSGRTAFRPTEDQRELVQQLAAFGLRHSDICIFVKTTSGKHISEPTLHKYFSDELDTGRVKANVRIAQTLYKKAMAGDTACLIFWLKTQGGWSEKQKVELTGSNGGPIQSVAMTREEIREIARALENEV
jgi:hypothetical protein